jgi:hydrogenase nickel incorporation protein HypA/HybF
MHELSVAMSLIDLAHEESEQYRGRIRVLHLRIGEMVGIVPDILLSVFRMATMGTDLEGAEIEIERVPAMIFCSRCNGPRRLRSLQWFGCRDCGTLSGDITQGREFELAALEID